MTEVAKAGFIFVCLLFVVVVVVVDFSFLDTGNGKYIQNDQSKYSYMIFPEPSRESMVQRGSCLELTVKLDI